MQYTKVDRCCLLILQNNYCKLPPSPVSRQPAKSCSLHSTRILVIAIPKNYKL